MNKHLAGSLAFAFVVLLGCSSDEPSMVQADSPVPTDTPTAAGWVDPACLDKLPEEAVTLGVLFEADQRLVLDRDDGGKVLSWTRQLEWAPEPSIVLDSGLAVGDHVEGSQALCARVAGIAGWQILARLSDTDEPDSAQPVDVSDFSGGYLEFELKSDTPMAVVVKWATRTGFREGSVAAAEFAKPSRFGGDWMTVRIPLCRFQRPDLSAVLSLIGLYPLFQTARSTAFYCADAIRWLRPGSCPDTCL